LFKQTGEFGFSVRNKVAHFIVLFLLCQSCYDFPENKKTFVDIYAFFGLLACCPCETLFFRSCKIYQLEFTNSYIVLIAQVLSLYNYRKYWVRARRHLVEVMRSMNSVLWSILENVHHFIWILALEYEQIFNNKLVFLSPSYTKTLLIWFLRLVYAWWVK